MTQRLYLAYGSNLCKANMRRRCPGARAAGVVRLNDCRLIFRGVADVVPAPGHQVVCGLWKISAEDERRLDAYEGVLGNKAYAKRYARINRTGDKAMLYVMTARGIYPPTQYYVDVVRQGYRDFGIDQSILDAAIEYSITGKDPCEATLARRQRQLKAGQVRLARLSLVDVNHARCVDCGEREEVRGSVPAYFVCSICQNERKVWKTKRRVTC